MIWLLHKNQYAGHSESNRQSPSLTFNQPGQTQCNKKEHSSMWPLVRDNLGPLVFRTLCHIFSLNKIRPKMKVSDSILISILSDDEVPALPLMLKARNPSLLAGRSNRLS